MKNNRRVFLKTSAKFTGVLTAFGLSGATAAAQSPGSLRQAPGTARVSAGALPQTSAASIATPAPAALLNAVLDDALATKDMRRTLPKFRAQLTAEQHRALQALTPQELMTLEIIRNKLNPLTRGKEKMFISSR